MKKIVLLLFLGCIYFLPANAKGKMTHVSAEIQGFNGEMVYFDFIEKDGISAEFPYQENQLMEVDVELDDVTMLRINAWVYVCLQPGDSIHAKIVYEGKSYKTVEYSGTPRAVAICTALHKMRELQRVQRYKRNIPANLVLQVEAKEFYTTTLKEWKAEIALLDEVRNQISPEMYNYILSDLDGIYLTNLITYPYASSGFHKKKIQDCMTDGYWDALNDYKLRDDKASLRNRGYMAFLLTYKDYMKRKKAGNNNEDYTPNRKLEEEYADLADFYDGSLRDAALFVLLYNAISNNGDFDRIEKLKKDYLKKYNKDKEYKKVLAQIMK